MSKSRKRRRFVIRAKFADGETVMFGGLTVTVTRAVMARPGYFTDDGRFFSEDELKRLPRRKRRRKP